MLGLLGMFCRLNVNVCKVSSECHVSLAQNSISSMINAIKSYEFSLQGDICSGRFWEWALRFLNWHFIRKHFGGQESCRVCDTHLRAQDRWWLPLKDKGHVFTLHPADRRVNSGSTGGKPGLSFEHKVTLAYHTSYVFNFFSYEIHFLNLRNGIDLLKQYLLECFS